MYKGKKSLEISYRKGRKSLTDIETFSKSKGDAKIVETLMIKMTKILWRQKKKK